MGGGRESTLLAMILSLAPAETLGLAPLALVLLAVLAYGMAALPGGHQQRLPAPALVVGWILHAVLLVLDIGGWGRLEPGARLGFGPVLSLTVWMVLAVHTVESRFVPLPSVRRSLGLAGALVVPLAWLFPGAVHPPSNVWAPVHWAMGVGSYALFGAAVLHAALLDSAERRLRQGRGMAQPVVAGGPMTGLPLLKLERITFRFVEVGFVALTLTLLLGARTAGHWQWSHKTVFALLGWAVFATLLAGRQWWGWRGRRATRWLLLLLAYVGSRFVFEVLLGRPAV
jgi:ABC-type uncharacterized transport system permease subunit